MCLIVSHFTVFRRTVARLPTTEWRLGAGGGTLSVIRTTNGQIPHERLLEVTPPLAPNRLLAEVHLLHFLFKSFFQFLIKVFDAFVALIVKKQAKRQTVRCAMFYYASTAFSVVWASCFRTGTLGYIFTIHRWSLFLTTDLFFCINRNASDNCRI